MSKRSRLKRDEATQKVLLATKQIINLHQQTAMRSTGTGKELMLGKLLSLDARNKIRAEEEAEDDECAICMEKLYGVDFTGRLKKCSHTFCFQCIHKWSETETTCPMCKCEFREVIKESGAKQRAVDAAYEAEMSRETVDAESNLRKSKRRKG